MRFWSFPKQGKRRHFQLRVEHLENRYCPSVSVTAIPLHPGHPADGYRLQIIGDSGADTVNILDHGNQNVSVTDGAGKLLGTVVGVRTIHFQGGAGTDTVNYTLTSRLSTSESIYIDLGNGGNDQAKLDYCKGVIGSSLFVVVSGGSGDDNISATLGSLTNAHANIFLVGGAGNDNLNFGAPADIDARSSLRVSLSGGSGNDQVYAAFSGLIFGALTVWADGGSGNDTVNINVKVEEDSTGSVNSSATGGTGTNDLTLYMNDYSGDLIRSTLSALKATIVDQSTTSTVRATWANVTLTPNPIVHNLF